MNLSHIHMKIGNFSLTYSDDVFYFSTSEVIGNLKSIAFFYIPRRNVKDLNGGHARNTEISI